MIEIKIPADIHAYKSKLIFGFTTRQVISLGAALGIGVPLGVFGKKFISDDILSWLVIGIVAPVIAWGFFTYKDMKFEDYVRVMLNFNWYPQKRVYEDTECNIFARANEEINEIEITQQRINTGELDTNNNELDI
ncbi:MAG TPA: PrgI family protein [Ruminococcus flavefaciens]|nr:PrgI family protein [Ruminococcus flavefaciens]